MSAIELLIKLRLGYEKLAQAQEDVRRLEKEIAEYCNTTADYEVVVGSKIAGDEIIEMIIKNAKFVSVFSLTILNNPAFAELVKGKRYGFFFPNMLFYPVVKFIGFDFQSNPDEYNKGRKMAELVASRKFIVTYPEQNFGKSALIF